MKREPRIPKRPKGALKCRACKGAGKVTIVGFWSVETLTCRECGGKGVR